MSTEARAVIEFWFGELDDGFAAEQQRRRWFSVDPARDAEISERFGALLTRAAAGELREWAATPPGALALILVCDQFSRQIHRGRAAAFATDALALGVARSVIAGGHDRGLPFDHRAFLYLPFEHSESRIDQNTSVGLFTALRDASPAGRRHLTGNYLQYAHQHRDIVLRFGRFPHRNAILGRDSSAEEREFLASAANFGQTADPAPP